MEEIKIIDMYWWGKDGANYEQWYLGRLHRRGRLNGKSLWLCELGEGAQHLLVQGISECQGDCAENQWDFSEHDIGTSISLTIMCVLDGAYTMFE